MSTTLNLTDCDKRGYYQVGPEKYYRKVDALLAHKRTGIFPQWNFNDQVFDRYNWENPVDVSLNDLYKIRAQQLRDRYDYLILCFSGGIDSYTILRAFVDNNIPLDEILIFGAFEGTESSQNNSTEAWNIRSEVDYQALPLLKKLNLDSKIKITVYDYTKDLIEYYKNPNWMADFNPGVRYNASMPKNLLIHNATRNYLNQYDQGRRVGFIHGIDKPRVAWKDGHYWMYFIDIQLSITISDYNQVNNLYWENDELFYWTPDLPELVAKQAQIICNWFDLNPHLRDCLDLNAHGQLVRDTYYDIINPLIYSYNKEIVFKVKKPYKPVFQENEYWFRSESNPAYHQWLSGIKELKSQVPVEWCNDNDFNKGIIGCYSKFYKIK